MSWMPQGTELGRLRLLEVYDYFDGPRLFAARNLAGTTFLVLWADELEDRDVWFYVPLSAERLASLRDGALPIRDAYIGAEDGFVYSTTVRKSDGDPSVEKVAASALPLDCLPPENDRLKTNDVSGEPLADAAPVDPVWTRSRAFQRLNISRNGRLPPPLGVVANVLGRWQSFFQEALALSGGRADMLPIRAVPGSFQIDLAISDPAAAVAAYRLVSTALGRKAGEPSLDSPSRKFPLAAYQELLAAISEGDVTVTIEMAGASLMPIEIAASRAQKARIKLRSRAEEHLSTSQVPQADDLLKVFQVLEITSAGREVTADRLGIVHRQVNYYKHAGRVLGYLGEDNELTAAGRQSLRLGPEERLVSTAVQFENSACGSAWVSWARVGSLAEITAESAEAFLVERSDLSAITAGRRALTLRTWLGTVLPYHYTRWYKRNI